MTTTQINNSKRIERQDATSQYAMSIIDECNEKGYSVFELAMILLRVEISDFSITIGRK